MNIGMHGSFQMIILSGYIPRSGIARPYGNSIPSFLKNLCTVFWDFPGVQRVKSLPTMREVLVRSLSWEDPLEKEMATHSSTLAWKIPWTEKTGGLQSMGSQRVGYN